MSIPIEEIFHVLFRALCYLKIISRETSKRVRDSHLLNIVQISIIVIVQLNNLPSHVAFRLHFIFVCVLHIFPLKLMCMFSRV